MSYNMKTMLFFIIFLLLIPSISSVAIRAFFAQKPQTQELVPPQPIDEMELLSVVNNWRINQGKTEYYSDPTLCEYADLRVEQIKSDWSHDGFYAMQKDGSFSLLGENLSRYDYSPEYVFGEWLNSPEHRQNLERDFTHSCIRCEDNYCAHIFAK